jgi:hypothetical protein
VSLPDDLAAFLARRFHGAALDAARACLMAARDETGAPATPRMLRSAAWASRGDPAALARLCAQLAVDWRDVIVAGECEPGPAGPRHVRDFDRPMRDSLRALYEAARYAAIIDGAPVALAPGRRTPAALRAWLGGEPAALVTAWNPFGAQASEIDNARAQARLEAALRGAGARLAPAEGASPDGAWREASLLAAGVDAAAADALCVAWRQNAVLWIDADGRAALRFHPGVDGDAALGEASVSEAPPHD